jgi:hypothetical protein
MSGIYENNRITPRWGLRRGGVFISYNFIRLCVIEDFMLPFHLFIA